MVHTATEVGAGELAPGAILGSYQLLRRLACGGMAEIYLAKVHGIEGFEKIVCLKRILPQFAQNRDFVTMFLDEARLSATLQHPNIAQVHDIGQWEGSYFFTMEYVQGQDIRGVLQAVTKRQGRIPLAQSLTMIAGAAAGLHAAHEKRSMDGRPLNIVHRDVSPSNVLVSYDGAVKLVDFGVAKAAQRQTETRTGTLKGKLAYMSPEQCMGKKLDRRSDIFSLGILLCEMTTGRRLFKGDGEFAVMQKIVNEDVPPPSLTIPSYPKELEAIVLRALKRNRDERYATAQELQLDLETFASNNRLSLSQVMLARFMQTLFADNLRDEAAARDPGGKAATEILVSGTGSAPPLPPPRPKAFAGGTPVPQPMPTDLKLKAAVAGTARLPVEGAEAAASAELATSASASRRLPLKAPISTVAPRPTPPAGAGEAGEAGQDVDLADDPAVNEPTATAARLQTPMEPTRVGSVSRAFSEGLVQAAGPITGSVALPAHRRSVVMAAIIGALVAALIVAAFAFLGRSGRAGRSSEAVRPAGQGGHPSLPLAQPAAPGSAATAPAANATAPAATGTAANATAPAANATAPAANATAASASDTAAPTTGTAPPATDSAAATGTAAPAAGSAAPSATADKKPARSHTGPRRTDSTKPARPAAPSKPTDWELDSPLPPQ